MADFGNQLEGAAGGLERLSEGFDNLMIRLTSASTLEAQIAKEKQSVNKQLAKINKDKLREEKKALPMQRKMTIQLQQRLKNTTLLNKGLKETVKGMKLFEKSMSGLKSGIGNMGKGIGKMGAAVGKAGIIGGLVIGVKFLIDGLLKVDTAMAKMTGRLATTRDELSGMKDAAIAVSMETAKWGITFEQTMVEAANLAEHFGSIRHVSQDLIDTSIRLQKVYGVSAESAGQLVESLERANRNSKEFVLNVGARATKEGVLTSLVMRDLASQSKTIAIQSERGLESMKYMAIEAAKAGGSLSDFSGIEAAYSDIENIAGNVGKVSRLMGADIRTHMGGPLETYMMAQRGDIKGIHKRIMESMKATLKVNKEGRIVQKGVLDDEGKEVELLKAQKDAWADLGATSFEVLGRQFLEEDRLAGLSKEKLEAEKLAAAEQERQNKILEQRQNALERIANIFSGVMDRITTAFSDALGIDDPNEGVHGMITKISKKIEEIFSFSTLQRDVQAGGSGLGGFVKAMEKRLDPLFEYIANKVGRAFGKAVEWFQENYTFDLLGGGFKRTKESLKSDIAKQDTTQGTSLTGMEAAVAKKAELEDQWFEKTQERGTTARYKEGQEGKFKKISELEAQAAALDKDSDAYKTLEIAIAAQKEALEETKEWTQLQRDLKELRVNISAQDEIYKDHNEEYKRATKLRAKLNDQLWKEYEERETEVRSNQRQVAILNEAMVDGKGRVHRRGGAALVGEEGRGEVVISRSALRSGMGVSGRAASALSGIGVPGFYRGAAIEGTIATAGLRGRAGSEKLRSAQATAFQDEQVRQQAAMMEYWRGYYEDKMDDAVDEKVKKQKEGPPWLAKMFLKYSDTIGKELNKRAGKTMTAAIMVGMEKWSKGGSLKSALNVGVKAGILEGLNDPKSQLSKLVERTGVMADTISAGLAQYAGGASMGDIKRTLVGGTVKALTKKYLGDYLPGAATGKYVNSPTLMMVGEEGRGEVVIPTERIRKGLPINAGVANELASIGVPGFYNGGYTDGPASRAKRSYDAYQSRTASYNAAYRGRNPGSTLGLSNTSSAVNPNTFKGMGGLKGIGKAGAAAGLMGFADAYMSGEGLARSATAGVGAAAGQAIGMGATALLSATPLAPLAPFLGPLIGSIAGPIVGKGLNKIFGLSGGQKKARRRAVKALDSFVKARGVFDFGQPNISKNMNIAIGGKEKQPTEENYNKLVSGVGQIRSLKPAWAAGIGPEVLIGLQTGEIKGQRAHQVYGALNTALYGQAGGDEYMRAVAMPQLAKGGIVTKPTTAVIGESGPEMVIPLHEQRTTNESMIGELKKQNALMMEMIKTQKESGGTEIRLDGRKIAESVGQNFYDMGNGV